MKCGRIVVWKINQELRSGVLMMTDGRYWSFVASERSSDYGIYHAGYAIEGCTVEKDERKDGVMWITLNDPKEQGEGESKAIKVLKAKRCWKDDDDDMNFEDEACFNGALYSNGNGVLQGFLYSNDEEDEEPPKKSSGSGSRQKKNTSSGKVAGGSKKKSAPDLW